MNKTATSFDRLQDKSNVIDGHAPVNEKVQVIARSTMAVGHSAGGLNSNITDLAKWVRLLLNNGSYEGKQIFSTRVAKELWTPQTLIPVYEPGNYNTHFSAYALGFGVSDVSGYKQVSHTGGLEGMVTQITMIPELNLGIIVLTNQQEGGAFSSITNQIKDGYLGKKGEDWVRRLSENREVQKNAVKVLTDSIWNKIAKAQHLGNTNTDISLFTGTYKDVWLGEITISIKNGKPWFDSKRSPKLTGELFPYKGNTFVVKWRDRSMDADAFVNFSLDEEGKASGITMKAISPLTDFSYDFQDLEFHRVK